MQTKIKKALEILEELHMKVNNKIIYSENDESDEGPTINAVTANLTIYELKDSLEEIIESLNE